MDGAPALNGLTCINMNKVEDDKYDMNKVV